MNSLNSPRGYPTHLSTFRSCVPSDTKGDRQDSTTLEADRDKYHHISIKLKQHNDDLIYENKCLQAE